MKVFVLFNNVNKRMRIDTEKETIIHIDEIEIGD